MLCSRGSHYRRVSSGHKTWIYLIFQGRGLRRAFLLMISPPPSCNFTVVRQNQWHIAWKGFSSHVIGLIFLLDLRYMPCLPYGDYKTWPGGQSCSRWSAAWYYKVAWLPGTEKVGVAVQIGLRIKFYLGLSVIQWVIGLTWPPRRWRPILTYLVIFSFSDPQ